MGSPQKIQKIAARIAHQSKLGWRRIAVVVSAMSGETNRLVGLVKEVNPTASSRSYDMAISAGEQVSVGLMAAALEAEGLEVVPLLSYQLGIRTDNDHSRARILSIDAEKIPAIWKAGKIPVVAGFQGVTSDSEITTLGRGGSDTSAVALAVALSASFCEINTDVAGVFTTDPRMVPSATLIDSLDFEVALEMASLGSKVLHPRCVELAAKYAMPLVVRDTFDENTSRRTVIMDFSKGSIGKEGLEAAKVSGITLDKDVAKITLRGVSVAGGNLARIFSEIARAGINVDIIVHNASEGKSALEVGFTLPGPDVPRAVRAVESLGLEAVTIETRTGLAKVSAVGVGMRSQQGVAAQFFEALRAKGIDILMISTSEIKISCVVAMPDAETAVTVLHASFLE